MAKIAVVDDMPDNRELLATILKAMGHEVHEAADGAEALRLVARERPALVICDVLMPVVDGYEFVRQLRADPAVGATPVVFYTAYYLEDDARRLADACGVLDILTKPTEPEEVMRVVAKALQTPAVVPEVALPTPEFDRRHLHLMTGKLAEKVAELQATSSKLEALIELNLQLASQRDLAELLQRVCRGARLLIGGEYGSIAARRTDSEAIAYALHCGLAAEVAQTLEPLQLDHGLVGKVYHQQQTVRRDFEDGGAGETGLPKGYPPLRSFVAAPLTSLTKVYGWVALGNKTEGDGFTEDDEKLLRILAAQVGRIYENGTLYRQATGHALELEAEIVARERAQRQLAAQYEVARILGEAVSFDEVAANVLRAVCVKLDIDAAALWTVDEPRQALCCIGAWRVPEAGDRDWAEGMRRMTLSRGEGVPGKVWASREPLWIARIEPDAGCRWSQGALDAGMRAGGGFPVVVRGEIAGVLEIFRREPHDSDARLSATLGSLGSQIGQFLERSEQQRRIHRLTRVYAVLSGINSAIVRMHDREQLFREACRIAVDVGGFGIAWIGSYDAASRNIRPIAWAGLDDRSAAEILAPRVLADEHDPVSAAVLGGEPVVIDEIASSADAASRGYRSNIVLPLFAEGKVAAVLALYAADAGFFAGDELQLLRELAGDVSFALEFIAKKDRLAFIAYHDLLTGMPNRAHLLEHLAQALQAVRQHPGERVAAVVWNIHRFRNINETFGRQVGDAVLRELGQRLTAAWPSGMTVARIGVDHFAGVVCGPMQVTEIAHLVDSVGLDIGRKAMTLGEHELRLAVAAGIAVAAEGEDADTVVRNAEAALRKAKSSGLGYVFYGPEMNARVAESMLLENRLRQALERDEFVLHYQPKVSGSNGHVTGLEALLRWNDPTAAGLVQPARIIPILEETGMILQVGLWAIRRALADAAQWRAAGVEPPPIAVNVSAIQLQQENFVDSVRAAINGAIDSPLPVDLEITESMIMTELEENIARLSEFRRMGGEIAIDDFGTGYSSLGYLAKLPVGALKIDKSFIETMATTPESMTIVSTIISLAHSLDLKVIAEGVELEEQAKYLRLFKCNELQGFLISRPLPPEEVVAFLRAAPPRPADEFHPPTQERGSRR